MKNTALIVLVLCCFQAAHAFDLKSELGDYKITNCKPILTQTSIDFCAYDEVLISPVPGSSSDISFSFLKNSVVQLHFSINSANQQSILQANGTLDPKLTLTSNEDGVQSTLSLENQGTGKVLGLSTSGEGVRYNYELTLTP